MSIVGSIDHRPGRVRRLLALIFAVLAVGAAGAVFAPAAQADTPDQVDSLKIDYTVEKSGVLHVRETWAWRFGTDSGRHGIRRVLTVREPDTGANSDKDAVWTISHFTAESLTPGVSAEVSSSTSGNAMDRFRQTTYTIGDPNNTIPYSIDVATYVLTYDVTGAMRTSGTYDELYWNAISPGEETPLITKADITATVPGGAEAVDCNAGPAGSTQNCTSATVSSGKAVFTESDLAAGDGVTIGVKIKPGLITDNKPHLERKAGLLTLLLQPVAMVVGGVILLIAIGVPIVGWRVGKSRSTDLRFVDLPPGNVPPQGVDARVGKSDPHLQIPVDFVPPPIPVGEAGLLIDGQVDVRDTTATLIDLAVRGAITIEDKGGTTVRLLDPSRATAPHETMMLTKLFGGRRPGASTSLDGRGTMTETHKTMVAQIRNQVAARGWFTSVPKAASGSLGIGCFASLGIFGWVLFHMLSASPWLLLLAIPLLSVVITVYVVGKQARRGRRTPVGRAVCDHVEGFKQYLETAEADQLRFEEGQDIFSRYLPWAIAFDLADRWQRICQQLVDAGRIPDQSPSWYSGRGNSFNSFSIGYLTGSLVTAATPMPSSSGGSGGGWSGSGGSSFGGGGGFSGGGGGGGGASSW